MQKQTKKPNSFWLKNKQILCIALATMGLLLGFNYEVVAQSNTSYNANSVPIRGTASSAFGFEALKSNAGSWNTGIGYQVLWQNTTGNDNTGTGCLALYRNTTGNYNTANGNYALCINETGSYNTGIGYQALWQNATGIKNTANGYKALSLNTAGNYNTANGAQSLSLNTTGHYNTASGVDALSYNSTGWNNTANGFQALLFNGTGNYNTANGAQSLSLNTAGNYNTALGYEADVSTGNLTNATAIGANAKVTASNTIQLGDSNVTKVYAGVDSTATVVAGGLRITGGSPAVGKVLTASDASGTATWQNVANELPLTFSTGLTRVVNTITSNLSTGIAGGQSVIGGTRASEALTLSSTKNATKGKILFGTSAYDELNNRLGIGNTAPTAKLDITGNIKIVDGTQAAGKVLTSDANGIASWQAPNTGADWSLTGNAGTDSTNFIGTTDNMPLSIKVNNQKAGRIDHKLFNTSYGYQSANSTTTGSANTVTGYQALYANTTGWYNTANGYTALYYTTGNHNTGTGYRALKSNAEGSGNTAMGSDALLTNNTGWYNTASGYQALYTNTTGSNNTASGVNALYKNIDGSNNTANGRAALYNNTTGQGNTASGESALYNSTAGSFNTASGVNALVNNVTGSNNTALGFAADVATGNLTNATAIGAGASVNASNKIRLGDAAVTEVETQFKYTTVSDGRFKNNVKGEDIKGLEFIKKLHPVAYNFDTRKFQEYITQNMPADAQKAYMNQDFSASTAIRRSGFIAQEVEKAAEEVGYDFDGVSKPQGASGNYSLAYSQFVVPLVKGMQEQQTQIEKQEQKIEQLQKVNEQLQQRLEALEKMIAGNNNNISAAAKTLPEQTAEDITLFPNPTTGMVTVKANHIDNGMMEVVDMQGNSVQKNAFSNAKSGYQFNVSGYAKGVYLLNIMANNKKYTKRLVVQ